MHTHAQQIVHGFVGKHLRLIHASRQRSWRDAVHTVIEGGWLSLSRIARGLLGEGGMKAACKRVDRLIGCKRIACEATLIEQALLRVLCPVTGLAVVAVDWSSVSAGAKFVELRASLVHAGMGRGLTICHRVYPLKKLGKPRLEEAFLKELYERMPRQQQVLIISDAGFRRPWFQNVEALGWDWIGRVRSGVKVRLDKGDWQEAKRVFGRANGKARRWTGCQLTQSHPFGCDMVLVKRAYKASSQYRRPGHGPTPKARKEARASAREPWLLACCTRLRCYSEEQIVAWFGRRMQIEENFRDHKSPEYGMGLSFSQSRSAPRLHALLMIGTLAAFILWHIGQLAEAEGLQAHFKATTRKAREVSVITLGRLLCQQDRIVLSVWGLQTLAERLDIPIRKPGKH